MLSTSNTKPVTIRHEQSAGLAGLIDAAEREILAVRGQPELTERLATRGYTAANLAEGISLQAAALDAYQVRQQALATLRQARTDYRLRRAAALKNYRQFRQLARTVCRSAGERTALALNGPAPHAIQPLLTHMHTAYDEAEEPVYADALARAGFTPAQLAAAQAQTRTLADAADAAAIAAVRARQATVARNEAATALRRWLSTFRRLVSIVADQPLPSATQAPLSRPDRA